MIDRDMWLWCGIYPSNHSGRHSWSANITTLLGPWSPVNMSQVRDCTLHNLFEVFEDMVECNFEWT